MRRILLIPLLFFLVWTGSRPFSLPVTAASSPTQIDEPLFPATATLNTYTSLQCEAQTNSNVYLPMIIKSGAVGQQTTTSLLSVPTLTNAPTAVDRSVSYDIYDATRFLYTGSNPVQTGLDANTIDRRCITVLRGNLIKSGGQPLAGVAITLQDHPELGQSLSDSQGLFNFVLNGGGVVVVEFNKTGYLSAQRQVETTRRQYEVVEPVVLIQPDSKTTAIDPTSAVAFQVAQGSVVSDNDGTRRATLLFPAASFATMRTQAENQKRPLSPLTFRATEFTAGAAGAAAMPGELPPTSGYTYAVDFSFDEPAGQAVVFDQPVINYTENIIGAPVGSAVPAGYYDDAQAKWIPADNGIVLKIVSITSGSANLDVTGDGIADIGTALTDLGITSAEQQQLATLYTAGQELWRVPIPHFSIWDFNWPFGPPADAKQPPIPPPGTDQPGECSESGSIINCDTQALGESLPIVGTPFTLNYNSKRVPGWKVGNQLDVPIVVGAVPASLKSVYMEAEVGGQMVVKRWGRNSVGTSFGVPGVYTGTVAALSDNLSYPLLWNGQDGYGRPTNGRLLANVMVRYVYDFQYYDNYDGFQQSFGQFGDNVFISSGREYCQYVDYPPASAVASEFCGINMVVNYSRPLGIWDAAAAVGLGGWSLDVHHAYDPNDGVLHLGDGRDLSGGDIGPVFSPAIPDTSLISNMGDFAMAPDGTLYFIDTFKKHIVRMEPDGSLTTIAGNGAQGYPTGDGGPATQATLGFYLTALTVGPDGAAYLGATYDNFNVGLIRRIDPDGTISTIAGTFFNQSSLPNGDGGSANAARLNNIEDLLFGPDGSLYIAESPQYREAGGNFNRIRKISPDGTINTIAGAGGNSNATADLVGVPALEWGALPLPGRMAFAPDGSLFIPHPTANTVSRIGIDGILYRFAGNGGIGTGGDGGAALDANVGYPLSVVVDKDSVVFIRSHNSDYYDRIRRVLPDGFITSYAGRDGCTGPQNNNGFTARRGCIGPLNSNNSLGLAPDGSLLVNSTATTIERIGSAQPAGSTSGLTIIIPDPNGMELYEFSSAGRHLRTLHALTGTALYTFGYNANGQLTTITDYDGNITTVERNGSGQPTAIVASGGQRTPLTLTGSGYLRTVANPAGNTVTLAYTASGLLTSLTDARVGVAQFLYDGNGRLTRDTNAAGKIINLSRLEQPGLTSVTLTTGMGEATTYKTEILDNGDQKRTVTAPDGSTRTLLIGEGGVWTLTHPDGSVERVTYAPDPRWGMRAPLAASTVITTPGSLQLTTTAVRTTNLATPNNPFSLITQKESVTSNGQTWDYTFNAANRTFVINSPVGRPQTFTLDPAGRILTTNHDSSGALTPTNLTYDNRGRLKTVNQSSRTTQFGYNSANWLTSQTAPDGRSATFTYDLTGRMTTAVLPGNRTVAYAYDASGNQTSLTPPGKPAHTFTYAADDQPLTYTPPTVSGGGSSQWVYNADRNLTTFTKPGGSVGLGYLNNGFNLGSVALTRGTRTLTYDAAGRIQSLSDPSGIGLNYTYDGPLITKRTQTGTVAGTVEFAYNANWLVGAMTVNNATPIAYQYDNDLLLTGAGSLTISRHPNHGLVTGSQLGSVSDAWTYNTYAEAASYAATYNSSPLYQTTFTRDQNGRIATKVETIGGNTNTDAYTYDPAGRLTGVSRNGSAIGAFTYDGNGNRLSANGTNATYDAQDRLLQAGTTQYTYTPAGERATKTIGSAVTTYQNDEAGNLMAVTLPSSQQITYLVDALNRRVGKRINGTLVQGFLYQGEYQPAAELDGSNAVVSRFVYGARANVPEYLIKGGQTYRIIADHLGSPRLVVNTATGQVAQRLDYDVWGNVTQDTNPGFQPFGFAGGLYDRDTGLVRFGLRDYDATTGQWLSKDPLGFGGSSTNLYAYVGNDPVNYIDPSGTAEDSAPSPCNPNKTWDERLRDKFNVLKKIPDWMLPKPLKQFKDGYKKLEKGEKLRDDIQSIKENLESPDLRDTAKALEDGLDYVPQVVPLTPMEVVKETIRRGIEAVQRGIDGREGVPNSTNQTLSDRWYATHADRY